MYHPTIVQKRLSNPATALRKNIDPAFDWKDYTTDEVQERVERLNGMYDFESGHLLKPLTADDEAFIRHEMNRCKVDFLYWATHYAKLKDKNMSLVLFNPTAVQDIFIKRVQDAEYEAVKGLSGDGIIFAVLKARQLGISTISEIIIAHRVFFFGNSTALIAADVDERTQNLYEMLVRVYDNLPWYLQPRSADPKADYRVKNKQLYFHDQDSVVRVGSASNMQGGDSGGDKGSLGTGMTLPLCHLSELALWPNPEQIDDALMPSIPYGPRTFAVFESTAKGRGNWWHRVWTDAKAGIGRRRALFIPWYTDPNTYKLPSPVDWKPSQDALAHAERVRNMSHVWCGKTVELTKDQLYRWTRERDSYMSRKLLHKFLAEFAADDMEAFQNSRQSVFGNDLIDVLRQRANQVPTLVEIKPQMVNDAR